MSKPADQDKFEGRVIKKLVARYRRVYELSYDDVQSIESLEDFQRLTGSFCAGSYKQASSMTLGGILNQLDKSAIGKNLTKFLENSYDEDWVFIFHITTSTMDYVFIPRDTELVERLQKELRFVSFIRCGAGSVAMVRLDEYLNVRWPEEE